MSNYLKPQSPIYNESTDSYIYPLTTSDQVIMPDGKRLDKDGLESMITPEGIGAMSMELLWENASPSSEFAAQIISLNLSQYKYVRIEFANIEKRYIRDFPIGYRSGVDYSYLWDDGTTAFGIYVRELTINAGSINFARCVTVYDANDSKKQSSEANNYIKPVKIYGIKGVN